MEKRKITDKISLCKVADDSNETNYFAGLYAYRFFKYEGIKFFKSQYFENKESAVYHLSTNQVIWTEQA